jgi:hypothetical protein
MLDRLELLLIQITELEKSRDAVLEDENPDKAASMTVTGTSVPPSQCACRMIIIWSRR